MTRTIQSVGIAATAVYAIFVVWLYVAQPRTIAELQTAAAVQVNVYQVDPIQFDLAMQAFRDKQHAIAVDRFRRADPAARDAKTQFLIATSHYEMGKGTLYDDDEQFRAALAAVDRALEVAPNNTFTLDDPSLQLDFTSAERLRERLRDGLEVTPGDFNPFSGGQTERAP